MKSNKLALTMIVKGTADEAAHLEKALKSVAKYVDGIFINVNTKEGVEPHKAVLKACQRHGAEVITTTWHDDFAEARNAVASIVPDDYNWIMWLDADDTIKKPHNIRKVLRNAQGMDAIYVNYLYDFDEFGNPTTVHLNVRFYRNNGAHEWKGRIHETLVETRAARTGMTEDVEVWHRAEDNRRESSLKRNIKLLELQLDDEKDVADPRTLFYLAGSYTDVGRDNDARALYESYIQLSGWDQERAQAQTALGRIAKKQDRLGDARVCFLQAIGEAPEVHEAYVELGQLEHELGNEGKALHWLKLALSLEDKPTSLVTNPQTKIYKANLLASEVCSMLGGKHLEAALEYAESALSTRPKDKLLQKYTSHIREAVERKEQLQKVVDRIRAVGDNKKEVLAILAEVPAELDDNPLIVQLRSRYQPFVWPEKSIAIYTGEAAIGEWGPWSLEEGIGGSEEAIIRISKHLKTLGYKVVVFATVGKRAGDYDGVQWRNHWECQLDDTFDIFIAWRNPYLFDKKINARKTYLWLHDVMDKGEFTKERLANIDKVILLSKYHRTCYPMIPDDKVFYSGNGIDPDEFEYYDKCRACNGRGVNKDYACDICNDTGVYIERDSHNVTYQSSHVRGLRFLYEIWPDVKKAVPDATLDVYYGWHSYDKINAGNPERMAWKDEMVQLAKKLDGVTDHGKVGQDKIVEATFRAGIWAYPTTFPEIYCITAVKCQAGGAVPVCTDYAALDEMVQYGEKMSLYPMTDEHLDHYKERLIWWLQHPEEQEKIREEMKAWARTKSWEATAEGWVKDFVN